jgi:hypothetical protein
MQRIRFFVVYNNSDTLILTHHALKAYGLRNLGSSGLEMIAGLKRHMGF